MDVDEVVVPVDDRRVEPERLDVVGVQRLVQREGAAVGEVQLGVGVRTVEVEVATQEVSRPRCRSRVRAQSRVRADRGSDGDDPVGGAVRPVAEADQLVDPLGALPLPPRHPDLAAVALHHRVLDEVFADQVVQQAEAQRVSGAGADRVVGGRARLGLGRGRRDRRVDHEIDRDDVDHAIGDAGEVGQVAAPERQDDRLGHLEAFDPAGVRLPQCAFDNARSQHGDRQVDRGLFDRALGHRLGEGVAVGPAEAAATLAAGFDQGLGDPRLAPALGLR